MLMAARPASATPGRRRARGVAALTVVMLLFFVMALVAAYTNRNLVFEKRISANGYRASRALEVADAGSEWALAMLNAGRITANCTRPEPDAAAGLTDFRSRYLVSSTDEKFGEGAFDLPWGQQPANRVYPACIIVGAALRCTCPAMGETPADIGAPSNGIGTAFRITFRLFNDDTPRGGAIQFLSRGCSNPGTGGTSCFAQSDNQPVVDGTTSVFTQIGLVRALPVLPKSTLTAGTTITTSGTGELHVANGDFSSGITAHAGVSINASGPSRFMPPAGTGGTGRIDSDNVLAVLQQQGAEPWFRAQFVMDRAGYSRQPATVRLDCAAGCFGRDIANAVLMNPRNPIWADGDVDLDLDGPLGTAADPVMLIVNGNLTISADIQARGFVHANRIDWTATTATWDGALVAMTSFDTTTVATLRYDKPMLDIIRLRYGSFVRLPGGWNLF